MTGTVPQHSVGYNPLYMTVVSSSLSSSGAVWLTALWPRVDAPFGLFFDGCNRFPRACQRMATIIAKPAMAPAIAKPAVAPGPNLHCSPSFTCIPEHIVGSPVRAGQISFMLHDIGEEVAGYGQ